MKKYKSTKEAFQDVQQILGQIHIDGDARITQNRMKRW